MSNNDIKVVNFEQFAYTEELPTKKRYSSRLDTSILSKEQNIAYEKYKQGENIFLTGPGGTGKTKLIQYFVDYSRYYEERYQVCAMTGCASLLLQCNARTLHSWSGIKLAKGTKEKVVEYVTNNKSAMKNWKRTKVIRRFGFTLQKKRER